MPHDDKNKPDCNDFHVNGKEFSNIMSSRLFSYVDPWSWSVCSRYYATNYLE